MSLRILYGRGGSGKSQKIYQEIRERMGQDPQARFLLLVPEQYTFRTEQKVLKELTERSVLRVSVMSIKSLVRRVLQTVGGATHPRISDTGKTMLMTKALAEVKDELTLFKGVSGKVGFIEKSKQLLEEIKRYDIDLPALEEVRDKVRDKELKGKLSDLTALFKAYEEALHLGHMDASDEVHYALERFPKADFLKGMHVYIDEFNDFSALQLKVLRVLLPLVQRVTLSLTMGDDQSDVFLITRETERRVLAIAEEEGISLERPWVIPDGVPARFQENPELAHLETEYFRYPHRTYGRVPGSLFLYKAQNAYDEVERVARDIHRRVREDDALRYRDVAILARNLEGYENLLVSVFQEYGIPLFLDKRRSIDGNPLMQYALALLDLMVHGFTYEALFQLLKTGLAPFAQRDVDLLENYVLAHGLKAHHYGKPWTYPYPNQKDDLLAALRLQEVNALREQLGDLYAPVASAMKGAVTARERATILYTHLEEDGVLQRALDFMERQNQPALSEEHQEVMKAFVGILDDMVEVLGEEPVPLDLFQEMLAAAIRSHDVALIPLTLDQVMVGDVARVKSGGVKGLYILGVNDGVLPRTIADEGLLSDRDLEKLKEEGMEVFIDTKVRSVYEQFLVYTAFSIASDFLHVSYAGSDLEGRALRPSMVVGRLRKLFPMLRETAYVGPMDRGSAGMEEVEGEAATFNQLVQEMRRNVQGAPVHPHWRAVYDWYQGEPAYRERLLVARAGLHHANATPKLTKRAVKALYGEHLQLSVSRLERFAQCPFSYFAEYGLNAKVRKVHAISAPDVGTLMHEVIDRFTEDIRGMEMDWSTLDKTLVRESVDQLVEEAMEGTNAIYKSSPRYRYMGEKVKRILGRSIETITTQIGKGSFVPLFNELGFGQGERIPHLALELPDGEEALLKGRIDRVDVLDLEGKSYIRIVDYKSSHRSVSLMEVYYGLQLQLLVYLDVILRNWHLLDLKEAVPGAVLYFRMDNPLVEGSLGTTVEEVEEMVLKKLKMKGLLLDDVRVVQSMDHGMEGFSLVVPARMNKEGTLSSTGGKGVENLLSEEQFQILRDYVHTSMRRLLKELVDGHIAVTPVKNKDKTPCSYCPYRSICQFDPEIPGNHYRTLRELPKEELWQRMQEEKEES